LLSGEKVMLPADSQKLVVRVTAIFVWPGPKAERVGLSLLLVAVASQRPSGEAAAPMTSSACGSSRFDAGIPDPTGEQFVPASGEHRLPVRQHADRSGAVGVFTEDEAFFALALLPQVTPFPAAQIGLLVGTARCAVRSPQRGDPTRFGPVPIQQL
jgi:hypothetical protein